MRYELGRFHRPMRRSTESQLVGLVSLGDGSTLTLDFTTGQLDPRLTFTRASNATFINSSGLVEWAAANMMTRSQGQDNNLYWNAFGTAVTRTSGQTDPFGGTGAVKLDYDATSADAVISRVVTVSQGLTYTLSVWLRADSGTVNNLRLGRAASAAGAFFPSLTTSWQRFSLTFVATGGSDGIELRVLTSGSPKTASFHVFGAQLEPGSTMRDYNPALLDVPYHAPRFDHDPTTLAPRGLLIEGTATNLLNYSVAVDQSPWFTAGGVTRTTFTGGTGPDGLNNSGSKLSAVNISSSSSLYYNGVTTVNGTTYTYSVFAKADGANWIWISLHAGGSQHGAFFDLSGNGALGNTTGTVVSGSNTITKYPNGWFKLTVAHTATTTGYFPVLLPCTSNGTGYGSIAGQSPNGVLVYGAQLESGSGASSYIPTGASTVQRLADICYMANADYGFSTSGGTYLTEWHRGSNITTGSSNNNAFATDYASGRWLGVYTTGASSTGTAGSWSGYLNSSGAVSGINRMAVSYSSWVASASGNASLNGGAIVSGTLTLGTTPTYLFVGAASGTAPYSGAGYRDPLNNCVRRIKYWPNVLPNAQLQSLTT